MTWDLTVDVAVVGGGACGLMTALRAARNPDLTVAVFEKSTREGCNAAISSGSLAAGGTRFQAAAGITDSPAAHARDILAASGDLTWAPIVHALCEAAPAVVEWLADELGHPVEIGADMPRAGMSVPRLHTDVGRRGGGPLVRTLREAVGRCDNVAFVDEAPAVALHRDGPAVSGVSVRQNGRVDRVAARSVVLACDGFAGSLDRMAQFGSDLGTPFHGGVATATGDALAWLEKWDLPTRNMGAFLRSGLVVVGHGTRVSPALQFLGAVLVNSAGERFLDEEAHGYSSVAGHLQALPGESAWMVFDDVAHDAVASTEMMRECQASGALERMDDREALARRLGVPGVVIDRALTPLRGRRSLTAPFWVAHVTHGVLTSQGGAVVDPLGRVLTRDGAPVPGLFAGGGTACGLAGEHSAGYSSGNGLLSAFGFGWIIGNHLAAGGR